MKKKLDNMNFLYSGRMDCYRHALFPIIKYYKRKAFPILLENTVSINYDSEARACTWKIIKISDYLIDIGLKEQYFIPKKDRIIDFCRNSIKDGNPIVCKVDIFYYSLFPAAYQKIHSGHGFPIYGYDDETQMFNIIDTDYADSFERGYKSVPYQDIEKGVISYMEYLKRENSLTRIVDDMCMPVNIKMGKYIEIYQEFWEKNINTLLDDLENFYVFCEIFANEVYYAERMIELSKSFTFHLDILINARILEFHVFKRSFLNINPLLEIDEKLIEKYNFIRSIFYRTSYTNIYREQSFCKCVPYMYEIYQLEKRRMEVILELAVTGNMKAEEAYD